eukprot:scaffold1532_cov120-Isochrysis_galbana.AAC.2
MFFQGCGHIKRLDLRFGPYAHGKLLIGKNGNSREQRAKTAVLEREVLPHLRLIRLESQLLGSSPKIVAYRERPGFLISGDKPVPLA